MMLTTYQQSSSTFAESANTHTQPLIDSTTNNFIYPIAAWQTHFVTLTNIAFKQHAMMAIMGDINSGKTTFIDTFIQTNHLCAESYTFCADPKLDAEELLEIFNNIFELTPSVLTDLDECYQQQLNKIYQLPLQRLIIIDDAHQLTHGMLEIIFNVIQHQVAAQLSTPQIQFILVGEPELINKLQQVQKTIEDTTLLHQIFLQPLTLIETQNYLTAICQQHGINQLPLTSAQLNKIYRLSEGYIGRLDSVATHFILKHQQPDLSSTPQPFKTMVKIVGSSSLILGIIIIAGLWWMQNIRMPNPPQTKYFSLPLSVNQTIPSSTKSITVTQIAPSTTSMTAFIATNTELDLLSTLESNPLPTPQPLLLPRIDQANLLIFDAFNPVTITETITSTIKHDTAPATNLEISKPETLSTSLSRNIAATPIANKLIQHGLTNSSNPPSTQPIRDNLAVIDQVISVPKIHPAHHLSAHSPKLHTLSKMEQQILHKPINAFTLQLLANSNEQALKRFIQNYHLQQQAWYYHTQRNHQDWFVLIYGQFNTKDQARRALAKLSPKLLKFHPWPRDYASIQRLLKKPLS